MQQQPSEFRADSHPAATAEHHARRKAINDIKERKAIFEPEPEVFFDGRRIIVEGSTSGEANEILEKFGLKPVNGTDITECGDLRRKAIALLQSELNVEVFEGPPGSATKAIDALRSIKANVSPIILLTLAPHDMGPSGHPSTVPGTISTNRKGAGLNDQKVVIAVLDTGMPAGWQNWHRNNVVLNAIASLDRPDPLYESGASTNPPNLNEVAAAGHGIFVAAVASRNSVPSVEVLAFRSSEFILSNTTAPGSFGTLISTFEIAVDLITAALSVDEHTPLIFNLSFGGYATSPADMDFLKRVMQLVEKLHPGTVFCAAAGNKANFDPDPTDPDYSEGTRPIYPAAFCNDTDMSRMVVSVGAIDPASNTIASYSGRGPWVNAWADGTFTAEYVCGRWTNTATGTYDFDDTSPLAIWSGTSFATPYVAAIIASECAATGHSPQNVWNRMRPNLPNGLSWIDANNVIHSELGGVVR